jgi:hypothetical protein
MAAKWPRTDALVAANQSFRSFTLAYATHLGSKKLDRPLPNFDRCRHS